MGWIRQLGNWRRRRSNPPDPTVRLVEGGFRVWRDGKEPIEVAWSEVSRVYAFKLDLGTIDCAMLGFELIDERRVEVGESWPGFESLLDVTIDRTGWRGDWINDVVTPPSATNLRVLWNARRSPDRRLS